MRRGHVSATWGLCMPPDCGVGGRARWSSHIGPVLPRAQATREWSEADQPLSEASSCSTR
jgi:hypothetical protein